MRILALLSILTLMVCSCSKERVDVSCRVDDQRPNYNLFADNPFKNNFLLSDGNVLVYSIFIDHKALIKMDLEGNLKWKQSFKNEIFIHQFSETKNGNILIIYNNKDNNFFIKKLNTLGATIIDEPLKKQVAKTNRQISYISDNQILISHIANDSLNLEIFDFEKDEIISKNQISTLGNKEYLISTQEGKNNELFVFTSLNDKDIKFYCLDFNNLTVKWVRIFSDGINHLDFRNLLQEDNGSFILFLSRSEITDLNGVNSVKMRVLKLNGTGDVLKTNDIGCNDYTLNAHLVLRKNNKFIILGYEYYKLLEHFTTSFTVLDDNLNAEMVKYFQHDGGPTAYGIYNVGYNKNILLGTAGGDGFILEVDDQGNFK